MATRTATAVVAPVVTAHTPAQAPPPRPIRSRRTKVRVAPGGCPATCGGQWSADVTRMWFVKSRRVAGMSSKRSMTWRYSYRVVSRRAMPRCQPSTRASENVHAVAVAQAASSRRRQGRRAATVGPYRHDDRRDGQRCRGAGADVGKPVGVQGRPADVEDVLRPLDGDTDQRGRHNEQCGGGDRVQVAAEITVHRGTSGRTAAAGPGTDADVSISSWFTDGVVPPARVALLVRSPGGSAAARESTASVSAARRRKARVPRILTRP